MAGTQSEPAISIFEYITVAVSLVLVGAAFYVRAGGKGDSG